MSEALTDLSEAGLIPWDWVDDETRDIEQPGYAATIADHARALLPITRIDLWDGLPPPLVITESRASKGVLSRLAYEYLFPLTSVGGMARRHIINEIAPLFAGDENQHRVAFYVGDAEIGGPADQIESHVRRTIEEATGRNFFHLTWQRIALTEEQVREHDLERLVIEKTDRRYRGGKKYHAVEVEALGQGVLVGLVRRVIVRMLPQPIETVLAREEQERRKVEALLRTLR
jgi:hypothetical protein